MVNRAFNLMALVVVGVILADILSNPLGTKTLIDGSTNFWKANVNGLLGKSTA